MLFSLISSTNLQGLGVNFFVFQSKEGRNRAKRASGRADKRTSEKRTEIGQARECSISPDRKRAHLGVVLVIKLGPQTSVFHGARCHLNLLVCDQPFPILQCYKQP